MTLWLAVAGAFLFGVLSANAVRVRRYSPAHIVGQLALGGRGLFFQRTPDGTWWKLRLRARRCATDGRVDGGDGLGGGVREPRRPPGRGPSGGRVELPLPGC